MSEADALEQVVKQRVLALVVNDETGDLDIDGDAFATWEMAGIAAWFAEYVEKALASDAEPED